MANRPRGYGLTAEVKGKMAAKYEIEKEQEARVWMEALVGEPLDANASPSEPLGPDAFYAALKNGTYLCKVAERVTGKKVKFNNMNMAFKQMENISNFLSACEAYGIAKTDLFQTVDLYENQNLWQVVCTIHALGRKAQSKGFDGPVLGPKESQANRREFTQEQLAAGQNVIGLQMGSNEGATQAGQSFGKSRGIMGTDK
ncbi:hypothetical protein CAPTEDRAFT_172250 [Capitella teleta]|uniref:Calponin-homology (CH) domain-containing protein n=1 Tax=Capitella teleta TaxID=283909 RepID=R7UHC1_CAPTE|nr:hypothetical protein CAPTEDRAFT_172250 [Capitella teleta]|eukprot:ELU05580.1 hypothetical protein CAPTEDRAFT_172250 [Capitella teleta]